MQAQIVHYRPYHHIAGAGALSLPAEVRQPASGVAPGGAEARILVIGHREGDVTLVRQALDGLGVGVEWASNEAAAWTYLATRRYDLVMVLVPLPKADELSLCRRLRVVDARRAILIVDTTGAAVGAVEVLAACEAGADAYLAAPLAAGEMRARVSALLGRWDVGYRLTLPRAVPQPAPSPIAPPLLARLRHAVQGSTLPMARRTRVALAAGLIVTGIAGDRVVRSLQPTPFGAVASTRMTTTTAQPHHTAVKHSVVNAPRRIATLGSGGTSIATLGAAADGLAVTRVIAMGLAPAHVAASADPATQAAPAIASQSRLQQSVSA